MKALSIFFFLSLTAWGATDIGTNLNYKKNAKGDPSFGVTYSYQEVDPSSYLFTFTSQTSSSEAKKILRWNFYLKSKDSFLFSWSAKNTVSVAVFQVRLKEEKDRDTIEKMIKAHNADEKGELFLVLADDKNKPVYNISISGLCNKYPDHFADMSYSRKCDNAKL